MDEQWEILSKTLILDRYPWLRVWDEAVRLPDGRVIPDWTRLDMPEYAIIFAVTEDQRVPLIRNYKHGLRGVAINLPGGHLSAGESPLVSAQRELLEEAGVAAPAENWTFLGKYVANSNREAGWGHYFLVRDVQLVAEPDPGDLEQLELFFLPLDEVRALWRSTQVCDESTAAASGRALDELRSS